MKIMLSFFSLVISIISVGQVRDEKKILTSSVFSNPIVYVDSVETRMGLFEFDSSKIKSLVHIQSTFNAGNNSIGKIYITSKNPADYNFLSFTDLKNRYIGNNKKPVLLLLNGNFIKKPTEIKIDSSYIINVEVESGADFEELKNLYPLLCIVNIQTKDPSYLDGQRLINLNGPERQILLNGLPRKSFPE